MDSFDKIAVDRLDGKDCAGGCCSASDVADAIRAAVAAERDACAKIAGSVAALYANSSGSGDPSAKEIAGDIEWSIRNRK